ncbi:hypothetical protein LEM8419_00741 [Neolewinella maritima]|uniref:Uncharacterized protein n=1 Tax=Neolewinella maritima TaxID=1383882 RepID=A0ABM9AXK8_9BACT|nr:hypothetical protein [Neolewinella maritima]CAH0999441.1 hypothetical protein LEM8419_00741 [Neolewinella maritima]
MPDHTTFLPLPALNVSFALLTLLALYGFYRAVGRDRQLLGMLLLWLLLVSGIASTGFFLDTRGLPPRLAFVLLPMVVVGLLLGFSRLGARLRARSSLEALHYLQGVRVLVEVVFLHGLYTAGYVARAMTYAGYNFDLLPGLLGPLVGYAVFKRQWLGARWAIGYNVLGIAVLLSVVIIAVFSAETGYQRFGLGQPTVAIFYLPFVWLPAVVVPLMLWAHFISLGKLMRR